MVDTHQMTQHDLSPHAGKNTLAELRQMYFELKEEVFSTCNRLGYCCNSQRLEELLKRTVGTEMVLTDVLHPK